MRGQIASAVGLIVQVMRLSDGKRKVTSVTEITGMEGQVVQMQEIFAFNRTHTDADGTVHGEFRATGLRPALPGRDDPPRHPLRHRQLRPATGRC